MPFARTAIPAMWTQSAIQAVRSVDPSLLTTHVKTLTLLRDERLVNERLLAVLSACFGVLALLLAAVGVYGLVAYTVAMRTSEFGLRIALGASRLGLLWLVMRGSLTLVAIAVAVGVTGAYFASSLLAGVLFDVRPAEPWVYAITVIVLLVTGGLAALGPTLRATRIDPAETLRWS